MNGVESNIKDYIGQRKHWSQMSDEETDGLFKRLRDISNWEMGGHALDRLSQKGIEATYNDIISTIHNCAIIEYKIDEDKYGNADERIVVRARARVNKHYHLNVVYSLTKKSIVTVWINDVKDLHRTLNWNIYNADMKVFGIAS